MVNDDVEVDADVPPFVISSMLANLGMPIAAAAAGLGLGLVREEIEGVWILGVVCGWKLSGAGSAVGCSAEGAAVGTKNFGLGLVLGLMVGTEGDWNKLVGLPPPWLKVSTYLARTPILPRAENWFEVAGIGGIPEPRLGGVGLAKSELPLLTDSVLRALFKL